MAIKKKSPVNKKRPPSKPVVKKSNVFFQIKLTGHKQVVQDLKTVEDALVRIRKTLSEITLKVE